MAVVNLQCKYCLAQLKVVGENHYRCESCGNEVIEKEDSPQELSILLVNAFQDLRLTKFDDAVDRFTDIIVKYPDNYMAYWGLCLAEHGVVFVEDRIEEKMVPTCYNMEIKSFLDNPNYQKAIELAPEEQVKNYEYQAAKIEYIRKEWIEKANSIPPYDIFISFKHRDEFGNVTSDYEYLNDLWYELTYKYKLNVFFSPQTLKDKVSEKFEPYIYRALHTSKVMLLYGEKAEYFETTWVKNEWSRYLRKIKNKEKHPKSLIVAYKNFNANLLPSKLKDTQALDANKPQFINILFDHINNILSLSKNPESLERIEIKTVDIKSKSRTIGNEIIQKRELGSNYVKTNNVNVEKIISTIKLLMEQNQFELATIQLNKVIEIEPNNSEVKYIKFLINNKIQNDNDLINGIKSPGNKKILNELEDVINTSDKNTGVRLLSLIKEALEQILDTSKNQGEITETGNENCALTLYDVLSQYNYDGRTELNKKVLEKSSKYNYLKLFNAGIKLLEDNQVDDYINYHLDLVKSISVTKKLNVKYVKSITKINEPTNSLLQVYYLKKILSVDEGNPEILFKLYELTYDFKCFENSLKYAKDKKEQVTLVKKYLSLTERQENTFYEEFLKYIPIEESKLYIKSLKNRYEFLYSIKKISNEKINANALDYSQWLSNLKWYVKQLIQLEGENPVWLFDLFKFELGVVLDDELAHYSVPLSSLNDFNDLLPNLDGANQKRLLDILNKQKRIIRLNEKNKEDELRRIEQERIRREEEEERRRKNEIRRQEESRLNEIRRQEEMKLELERRKAEAKEKSRRRFNLFLSCFSSTLIFLITFFAITFKTKTGNIVLKDYTKEIVISLVVLSLLKIIVYIFSKVNDYEHLKKTLSYDFRFVTIFAFVITAFGFANCFSTFFGDLRDSIGTFVNRHRIFFIGAILAVLPAISNFFKFTDSVGKKNENKLTWIFIFTAFSFGLNSCYALEECSACNSDISLIAPVLIVYLISMLKRKSKEL